MRYGVLQVLALHMEYIRAFKGIAWLEKVINRWLNHQWTLSPNQVISKGAGHEYWYLIHHSTIHPFGSTSTFPAV
jgi:hypothetical protein